MKKLRFLFQLGLCALALAVATGCNTTKRLEAGGAYAATDTAAAMPELYVLDATFDLAYQSLNDVFTFEQKNRATLWAISPEIKHGLDRVRAGATPVTLDYAIARDVYRLNPIPANLTNLQTLIAKMQAASTAAVAILAKKGQ